MKTDVIRFYQHDLYPEFSGIALHQTDGIWKKIEDCADTDTLERVKKKYSKAIYIETPLRDESFNL